MSILETIRKHKELVPLIFFTGLAVGLASSYVAFKSFFDNQVVFDRRHPFQYKEKEGIQVGRYIFGNKLGNHEDQKNNSEDDKQK